MDGTRQGCWESALITDKAVRCAKREILKNSYCVHENIANVSIFRGFFKKVPFFIKKSLRKKVFSHFLAYIRVKESISVG